MSRRPVKFREADLRKAKKVAGKDMAVEMRPDGTIRLVPVQSLGETPPEPGTFDHREPMVF